MLPDQQSDPDQARSDRPQPDRGLSATADFGSRFSAFMIDTAVLFAAQWVGFIVLSRQLQAVGMTKSVACGDDLQRLCEGPSNLLWTLLLLLLLVSTVGYYALFDGHYGATPGKRLVGLRVVGTEGSDPIGIGRGVVRSVVRQAFWLSLFFVLAASPISISLPAALFILVPMLAVGLLALGAFRSDARSAHDLVASTVVVRRDGPGAAPTPNQREVV